MTNKHPGKILLDNYLKPYGISVQEAARELGIDLDKFEAFVTGKAEITITIARKLAVEFDTTVQSWIVLQAKYNGEKRNSDKTD